MARQQLTAKKLWTIRGCIAESDRHIPSKLLKLCNFVVARIFDEDHWMPLRIHLLSLVLWSSIERRASSSAYLCSRYELSTWSSTWTTLLQTWVSSLKASAHHSHQAQIGGTSPDSFSTGEQEHSHRRDRLQCPPHRTRQLLGEPEPHYKAEIGVCNSWPMTAFPVRHAKSNLQALINLLSTKTPLTVAIAQQATASQLKKGFFLLISLAIDWISLRCFWTACVSSIFNLYR